MTLNDHQLTGARSGAKSFLKGKQLVRRFDLANAITKFKQYKKGNDASNITYAESMMRLFGYNSRSFDAKNKISNYWGVTDDRVTVLHDLAARVLQKKVRLWLLLIRSAATLQFVTKSSTKYVIVVQSAVRTWLTHSKLKTKRAEYKKAHQYFNKFCKKLEEGIEVYMFSRKYGTINKRIIKFDSEFKYLTWKIFGNNISKMNLREIFRVTKGLSMNYYAATPKSPAMCFSLHCAGGRALDFEACDASTLSLLIAGFERLKVSAFIYLYYYIYYYK